MEVVSFESASSSDENNSDNEAERHWAGEAERWVLIATQNAELARALENDRNRKVEYQQNQPEPTRQPAQLKKPRRDMLDQLKRGGACRLLQSLQMKQVY